MPKLTEAELVAAIEQEERQSIDTHSGELHTEREDALARYRGELLGNEQDGRSSIVDMTILDTIESIMPSLVTTFLGDDNGIGEFQPRGPEDEAAAKSETEAVNWMLNTKSDLFSQVNATLRDALLLKNGYTVAYWKTREDQMVESYSGLSDEEVAMLAQDPEVTITEHSERPDPLAPMMQSLGGAEADAGGPMLHDVKVERKKADEFVAIESIPPNELRISARHRWTSLLDCDFSQWVRRITIGQARAEGFDVPDDASTDAELDSERVERARFNENLNDDREVSDPTRRLITLRDTYIVIDYKGTGSPRLWRFVITGKKIILEEEAEIVPFAAFSPIIYPHSHIGSSVYDQIKDIGLIKTTLQRHFLDGVYQQHNGQKIVNTDNCPNLDDLLVARPGNIVRVTGNPSDSVMPLPIPDNGPSILAALQYMDDVNTRRTGVQTNAPQGIQPSALNNSTTATAVQAAQSQASERVKLIAMTLVSGFRDLFLITHALLCKHSTKPFLMRLENKWTPCNPREWTKRTDFKINVGLGTGSPQMKMAALQAMGPIVAQSMQMGLAGPKEAYNYGCELWRAAGYPVYERFLHPPQTDPKTGQPVMPPPPPDPHVQVEQIRQQGKGQELQMQARLEAQKMQADDQVKQRQAQAAQAVQQSNDQRDAMKTEREFQLKREQIGLEMHQRDIEHQRDGELQLQIAHIKANTDLEVARVKAGMAAAENAAKANADAAGMPEAVDPVKALQPHLEAIMQAVTAPRTTKVVRGPDGRVSGAVSVHPHAQTTTVQ